MATLNIEIGGVWTEIPILQGKSSYQAALEAGYVGSENDFNTSLFNIDAHIADGGIHVTAGEKSKLANTSGTNSGDNATNTTSNAYADSKVEDFITDGVTAKAPSENAVFDALLGKATTVHSHSGQSINPDNIIIVLKYLYNSLRVLALCRENLMV